MSDLISRSELTESIKRQYCTGCDNYNGSRCRACHADDMISLVDDAADAMPRWISVEERLPDTRDWVLVIGEFVPEGGWFVPHMRSITLIDGGLMLTNAAARKNAQSKSPTGCPCPNRRRSRKHEALHRCHAG